jgi:tRNA (guanine37-N1)-methyltransferase
MRTDVVTLFPEFFSVPLASGVVGRAVQQGRATIACFTPRDFTSDRHRTVDDYPYGGGPGMILKAPPLVDAVESIVGPGNPAQVPVVLLSPQGERFSQAMARSMASWPRWVLVCGRYKGIDERVRQLVVTHEISIGDYVLSGGEPAALVILDAVLRLLPGVLGDEESAETDSFGIDGTSGLDCGYYTRPAEYRGLVVPEVLLSGHHARIEAWRRDEAAERTRVRRPELAAPEATAATNGAAGEPPPTDPDPATWRKVG